MSTLQILLFFIILLVASFIGLLAGTLLMQVHKTGRKVVRLQELWAELLEKAILGQPDAVLAVRKSLRSRASWRAFHLFVDDELPQRRGRRGIGLRRLCREVGLTERLQRELHKARDPLVRAGAGRTLAHLRERIAEEEILVLLQSPDPAVVMAAAYATASFRDPKHLLSVFRAVYSRTPVTLHGAAELLSGFGKTVCPVIDGLLADVVAQHEAAGKAADETAGEPAGAIAPKRDDVVDRRETAVQVVLIDLLAFYAYRPAVSTLSRLLTLSEDEEVLIHVVKALTVLGDCSAVPRLIGLLAHPNWVLKTQSGLALATLGVAEAETTLRALLADGDLRVRTRARDALDTLASVGAGVCTGLAEASA